MILHSTKSCNDLGPSLNIMQGRGTYHPSYIPPLHSQPFAHFPSLTLCCIVIKGHFLIGIRDIHLKDELVHEIGIFGDIELGDLH